MRKRFFLCLVGLVIGSLEGEAKPAIIQPTSPLEAVVLPELNTFEQLKEADLSAEEREALLDHLKAVKPQKIFKNIFFVVEQSPAGPPKVSKPFKGKIRDIIGGSHEIKSFLNKLFRRHLKNLCIKIARRVKEYKDHKKEDIKAAFQKLVQDSKEVRVQRRKMVKAVKEKQWEEGHVYLLTTLQQVGQVQRDVGQLLASFCHFKLTKSLIVNHVEHLINGQNLFFIRGPEELMEAVSHLKNKEVQEGLKAAGKAVLDGATGVGILGSAVLNVVGPGLQFTPVGGMPVTVVKAIFGILSKSHMLVDCSILNAQRTVEAIKLLVDHKTPKVALIKMVQAGAGTLAVVTIIGTNLVPVVLPIVIPFAQEAIGSLGTQIAEQIISQVNSLASALATKEINRLSQLDAPAVASPPQAI